MKPFKPQHKQFALDYMTRHQLTENDIDDTTRAKILTAWRVHKKRLTDKQKGAANIRIEFKPIAGRLLIDTAKAKGVTPSQLIIELLSPQKPSLFVEPITTAPPVKREQINFRNELKALYGITSKDPTPLAKLANESREALGIPPYKGKPTQEQARAMLEWHKAKVGVKK